MSHTPLDTPVDTRLEEAVATVTLNRPDAMNALDRATREALLDALSKAAEDPAVRAVVLTGAGDRAFCVGQDLREHIGNLQANDVDAMWHSVSEHYSPITTLLATMLKPVVAAVNGVAAGAGAGFAFACDFRVVADTAGFNTAFTAIGLSADSGSSWTLPRLVGMARAKELLLMPRTVPAEEALALGLATQVVPAAEVRTAASALATTLASGPTVAYGAVRRALAFSATHALDESLDTEGDFMRLTGATADHKAAVQAFVGKQQPAFEGR